MPKHDNFTKMAAAAILNFEKNLNILGFYEDICTMGITAT